MQPPETPCCSTGESLEKLAFNFCKAATLILILGRWALPATALTASALYLAAHLKGQRETRCILKVPLLISAFWAVVGAWSLWRMLT